MIRLSKLARARVGFAAGCTSVAGGVGLEWGASYGLIVGGVLAAVSFLLLADVDEGGNRR